MSSTSDNDRQDALALSETRVVTGRVPNALAAAAVSVALAAFGVMFSAWMASSDLQELRDWPDGIAGWLVCVPALAATATLAIAAQWMRDPRPTER
jgi:hypothetical protein